MKKNKKSILQSLKEFYQLYTSGLTREEIEHLLKQETRETFTFYKKDTAAREDGVVSKSSLKKNLRVAREIFLSFIMKFTPARRLLYGVAFALFVFALVVANWYYAFFSFVLFNFLLALELADKLLTRGELEIARDIQTGLQPEQLPKSARLDMAIYCQPAKEVGGDYFDFVEIDDDKLAIIIGDVSGKGLPAALYAVKFQGLVELLATNGSSPKNILQEMNSIMSRRLRKQYFITSVIAVFDLKKQTVSVARAGHNPPLFYDASKNDAVWLSPKGIGIGLDNIQKFNKELDEKTVSVSPGDTFLFYTDGITEAMNAAKMEFGENRLGKVVMENHHLSSDALKEKLVAELNGFVSRPFLDDDVTLVLVKVK